MFRKLVSNLPFSPALIGQLGFYAKRLRKEEATRRLGLIFTALALVVQSFAVFNPPEAANAATAKKECNVVTDGSLNGENGPDRKFVVTNNRAFIGFKVKGGDNCETTVALKSWYSPSRDGTPHDAQVKFQEKERTLGPGSYTMGVDLPPQGLFLSS